MFSQQGIFPHPTRSKKPRRTTASDGMNDRTAVSSEAWAKLRDWASVAGRGRLLLSGSVAHASLKTTVYS